IGGGGGGGSGGFVGTRVASAVATPAATGAAAKSRGSVSWQRRRPEMEPYFSESECETACGLSACCDTEDDDDDLDEFSSSAMDYEDCYWTNRSTSSWLRQQRSEQHQRPQKSKIVCSFAPVYKLNQIKSVLFPCSIKVDADLLCRHSSVRSKNIFQCVFYVPSVFLLGAPCLPVMSGMSNGYFED
uniref:Voltage-dependent T-type calcium channel subunit alpha-1G n=1 Tax=Macrostomum lignano TaxID=282301 RepID=A0A1I8GTW4_9PLAT